MQLVEQHLIRKSDPAYPAIDQAAFASKNLYNQANYQVRQAFIHQGTYLPSKKRASSFRQDCLSPSRRT